MPNELNSLLKDTCFYQSITRDKIKDAYETYCSKYQKAIDGLKGQMLQDETAKAWRNFQDARDNALNIFDREHERAFDKLTKYLTDEYTKAPNSTVNNTLTALSLRSSLPKGDVEAAALSMSGSLMGLSTLRDIVSRIAPDCTAFIPVVPSFSEVLQLVENQKNARSDSMHNYLKVAPGKTDGLGELNNYLFDPESGLQSFFDAMDAVNEVLNGGKE